MRTVLTNLAGPQYSFSPDAGHHGGRHWASSPWTGQGSHSRGGAPDSAWSRGMRRGSCSSNEAAGSRTSCCPGPGAQAGPAEPGQRQGEPGEDGDAPWAYLRHEGLYNFLQWSSLKVLIFKFDKTANIVKILLLKFQSGFCDCDL